MGTGNVHNNPRGTSMCHSTGYDLWLSGSETGVRIILYIWQRKMCYFSLTLEDRLHVFVMWTWKFSCESNQTPRFRALFTIATLVSPTVRVPRLTLLSCWRVPINMTSVLFSLSFSLSDCINAFVARIHCAMACTASASLRELSGLKER